MRSRSPTGYNDAYSLDEIKLGGEAITEDEQVARWQAELKARARPRRRAGWRLPRLPRAHRQRLRRGARSALAADELGSDQAAWLLAQLAANRTCGDVDRAGDGTLAEESRAARLPARARDG